MRAWLTRLVARDRRDVEDLEVTIERAWGRIHALEHERNSLRLELAMERQRSEAADRRIGELLRLLADRRAP